MAEFYLCSTLMWNATLEEMVRFVYDNGLDGIEMWAQQWFTRGYSAEEYHKLSALYPIKTFVHSCSWDLNPASLNDGIRNASVLEIEKSIDLADSLGTYEVTVHPGHCTFGSNPEPYTNRMNQSLTELLAYAAQKRIDLSLEIMEKIPKEFVTSVAAMKSITQELEDKFYYTLDIAHCDGVDFLMKMLQQGKRFSKFHISNRRGNTFHTPLPDGDYDFTALLPTLIPYHLPFVIEGFDSQKEFSIAKKNINFLKLYGGIKS